MFADKPLSLKKTIDAIVFFEQRGHFGGRKIVMSDPEDSRNRQVYEDLDSDGGPRMSLLTIYPEHAKCHAYGHDGAAETVMSHPAAIYDMKIMATRFSYVITSITRDIK